MQKDMIAGASLLALVESKTKGLLAVGERHETFLPQCLPKSTPVSPTPVSTTPVSTWLMLDIIGEHPHVMFDLYLESPYYSLIHPVEGLMEFQAINRMNSLQARHLLTFAYPCIVPQYKSGCYTKNVRYHIIDPRVSRGAVPLYHQAGELAETAHNIGLEVSVIRNQARKYVPDQLREKVRQWAERTKLLGQVATELQPKDSRSESRLLELFRLHKSTALGENPIWRDLMQVPYRKLQRDLVQWYDRQVRSIVSHIERDLLHLRVILKRIQIDWKRPDKILSYSWENMSQILSELSEHWLYLSAPLLDIYFLARFLSQKQSGFSIFYGGRAHAEEIVKWLVSHGFEKRFQTHIKKGAKQCIPFDSENEVLVTRSMARFATSSPLASPEKLASPLSEKNPEPEASPPVSETTSPSESNPQTSEIASLPKSSLLLDETSSSLPKKTSPFPKTPETKASLILSPEAQHFLSWIQQHNYRSTALKAIAFYLHDYLGLPLSLIHTRFSHGEVTPHTVGKWKKTDEPSSLYEMIRVIEESRAWLQVNKLMQQMDDGLGPRTKSSSNCLTPDFSQEFLRWIQSHHWRGSQIQNQINLLRMTSLDPLLEHNTYRVGDLKQIQPAVPKSRGDMLRDNDSKPSLNFKVLTEYCPQARALVHSGNKGIFV